MIDQAERLKAVDPKISCWVNASAGSGKTKLLIDRIINLVIYGSKLSKILAITFTNAAAEEMRNRIISKMFILINSADKFNQYLLENQINISLQEATNNLYSEYRYVIEGNKIPIQTIHSLCKNLLNSYGLEIGYTNEINIIDEVDRQKLYQQVIEKLYQKADVDSNLQTAISNLSLHCSTEEFQQLIKDILTLAKNFKYFFSQYNNNDEIYTQLQNLLEINNFISPEKLEKSLEEAICQYNEQFFSFCNIISQSSSIKDQNLATNLYQIFTNKKFKINSFIECFFTQKLTPKKQIITKKIAENHPEIAQFLTDWQSKLEEFLFNFKKHQNFLHSKFLIILAHNVLSIFDNLAQGHNYFTFDDLITITNQILESKEHNWVNYLIYQQFDHILVDESQDTSPPQWRIITNLINEFIDNYSENPYKTIFIVGDEKQSIYSFQGADNKLYFAIKTYLCHAFATNNIDFAQLNLLYSFRSNKTILQFVDQICNQAHIISAITSSNIVKHESFRKGIGRVCLWPNIYYQEENEHGLWPNPLAVKTHYNHEQIAAKFIAEQINFWLKEHKYLPNLNRTINANDIMILVRKRGQLYYSLINELDKLEIANNGIDRLILQQDIIFQDILALLKFIIDPYDELNLAILLKSPFVNWIDDYLMQKILANEEQNLYEIIKEDIPNFFEQIDYQLIHNPSLFLHDILVSKKYYHNFIERFGSKAMEIIDKILEVATNYQHKSLYEFIYNISENKIEIKLNKQQEGLKLLTVHGSKGLEANIVIIADLFLTNSKNGKFCWYNNNPPAIFWKPNQTMQSDIIFEILQQNEQILYEEYLRLFYVASTRAREELYFIGSATNSKNSNNNWFDLVKDFFNNIEHNKNVINSPILEQFSQSKTEIYIGYDNTYKCESPENLTHHASAHIIDLNYKEELPETKKDEVISETLMLLGTAFHHLLEFAEFYQDSNLIKKVIEHNYPQLISKTDYIVQKFDKLLSQFAYYISHPQSKNEYSIAFKNNIYRLDKIIFLDQEIIIIDYKYSKNLELKDDYHQQISIYSKIIQKKYPSKTVISYILWIQEEELTKII